MLFPASIGLKTLSPSVLRLLLFYQSQRRASFPKKADFASVRSLMSGWAVMENHDNGWDLFAVVRSCRSASRPPPQPQAPARPAEAPPIEKKPFFCMDQQAKPMPLPCHSSYSPAAPRRSLSHAIARSKKRRNQQKRVVCQVPADGLAADMWAWRKYGQKPIKGSPYPRGYYRCSSSKGCSARKQVERSRADPGTFILTYTGEHNHPLPTHRNSLAGSTRQKLSSSQAEQQNPLESSPERHASGEDEEEDSGEEEEEEEGILLVEDMEVVGEDEVFFMEDYKLDDDASSSIFPEPLH